MKLYVTSDSVSSLQPVSIFPHTTRRDLRLRTFLSPSFCRFQKSLVGIPCWLIDWFTVSQQFTFYRFFMKWFLCSIEWPRGSILGRTESHKSQATPFLVPHFNSIQNVLVGSAAFLSLAYRIAVNGLHCTISLSLITYSGTSWFWVRYLWYVFVCFYWLSLT